MVKISLRMRRLQERLLGIRTGSGSVLLPKTIKRIHLRFAPKINNGHGGSRKFWRNELIRLQYHNPAVVMTVDNKAPQEEKAILSIHYVDENAPQTSKSATSSPAAIDSTSKSSKPSDAASSTRVETIDMTGQTHEQIFDSFVRITNAIPIQPSEEDLQLAQAVEENRVRTEKANIVNRALEAKRKRESELLEQARTGAA